MGSPGSLPRESLVPLVAALLDAERRIALLERRLSDARWIAPGEQPNQQDKEVARRRVGASIGALAQLLDDEPVATDDDF